MANTSRSPVFSEPHFPLAELRKVYPYAPSYRQLWRYARVGVRVTTGQKLKVVKLETVRLPRGLATSVAAYKRFIDAINE